MIEKHIMEKDRKEKDNYMVENQGVFPSNEVNWILGWPVKGSSGSLTVSDNEKITLDHAV